ncbi:MAG: hypothetical protein RIS70_2361 [Planctomycetota bacterium]|jgi:hypothetical protein
MVSDFLVTPWYFADTTATISAVTPAARKRLDGGTSARVRLSALPALVEQLEAEGFRVGTADEGQMLLALLTEARSALQPADVPELEAAIQAAQLGHFADCASHLAGVSGLPVALSNRIEAALYALDVRLG